jgi:3-hydroxy-3-methylglutaryl CoA synthase
MTSAFGILSFGAYLPRARMQRKAIAAANGWFAPGLKGQGKGERTIGNWDEDTITMAVEAARDCLGDTDRGTLKQVVLASTTHPFDDRQNATVVATALHLSSALRTSDAAGSLRAGTGALIAALEGRERSLVIASDMRRA